MRRSVGWSSVYQLYHQKSLVFVLSKKKKIFFSLSRLNKDYEVRYKWYTSGMYQNDI